MTDDEKYLFDLTGYLVLRQVLTPEEVARCNEAIDCHADQTVELERSLAGGSEALERPWCEPFREMLVRSTVTPYLETILGKAFRLDHGPGLIAMEAGCEGGTLHGGGIERPDFCEAYFFKDGRIYTGLTVVEYLLADEGPGDGGVAVVPGSHKANLACPREMKLGCAYQEQVVEVNGKAGDVVIFTEALTHGTLPWKGDHQRRALLYKFSPGFQSYGRGGVTVTYPDYVLDMTEEQQLVMEHPHRRKDRN